ncbi:MAG: SGNH/GDSL hydrolase family protein [Pirellulales bacterium]
MPRLSTRVAMCSWIAAIALAGLARADEARTIDKATANKIGDDPLLWYDIRALGIEGQGWRETKAPYDRLPGKAEGVVPASVWGLSRHSTGLAVRFVTDASTLSARWSLRNASLAMDHMPATGVSGVDLYVRKPDGGWTWLGIGRPKAQANQQILVGGLPAGRREYFLYLPLYNGVDEVQIGLPADSTLETAPARPKSKAGAICFYGTSITQGGCAARPGMAYPAIIGRKLERETINLGFSGSGKAEPEVAALLAELNPALFVLDCLPNLDETGVRERVGPLVETIRQAHPDTPIMLVENITYQNSPVVPASQKNTDSKNVALKEIYQGLMSSGATGLHYFAGGDLLGDDGEATVDGTHPTDLGFQRMADALTPAIQAILEPATP